MAENQSPNGPFLAMPPDGAPEPAAVEPQGVPAIPEVRQLALLASIVDRRR
jgi:hypothetical protein